MRKELTGTYSTREVADHLGVCSATVRKYVRTGKLRAFIVGYKLRFPAESLDKFIQRNRA
jgi:excisionase family DNA binding protein